MAQHPPSGMYELRKEIRAGERGMKGRRGRCTVALLYPGPYAIGISTLAFHRIWELTGRVAEAGALRYFLEGGREPFILPLDDDLSPRDADVIAFFLSYEPDYLHVVTMLSLLGIPLRASGRKGGRWPLVIGGGIAATGNPLPVADLFDALFIGEADESYPRFLERVIEDGPGAIDDPVQGVFVPARDAVVPGCASYAGFAGDPARSMCSTAAGEFGDTTLIEVSRGCPASCRFCVSRTLYRPVRFASPDAVMPLIDGAATGKIGLLGAAVSFHPAIKQFMARALDCGKRFSISSLRAERLDDEFIELLKRGGTRTMTIAPEAGTDRLRAAIGKGLSEDDILKAVSAALTAGMDGLKMYFMIGLPGECDDDLDGIVRLARTVRTMERSAATRFKKFSMTLSSFVPKPGTPFERAAFTGVDRLSAILNRLRKALVAEGVTVQYDQPRQALLQTILSRGDRSLLDDIIDGGGAASSILQRRVVERFGAAVPEGARPPWLG